MLWRRRSLVLLIIPARRVLSTVTQSRPISLMVLICTANLPRKRCGLPLHCQVHTALCHCAALYHWKWQSSNRPSSIAVEPPLAPVGLSTTMVVRGAFPSQKLYCRFGSVNTEASVLSETELRCPAPLMKRVQTVPFDVGYSKGEAPQFPRLRLLPPAAPCERVKPRSATIGTSITIVIAAPDDLVGGTRHLLPAIRLDTVVEAARPSSHEFGCHVPPLQPGGYDIGGGARRCVLLSFRSHFYVVEAPSVLRVEPRVRFDPWRRSDRRARLRSRRFAAHGLPV